LARLLDVYDQRASTNILYPLDLKIERTYRRWQRGLDDNHLILHTTSSITKSKLPETEPKMSESDYEEIISIVIMAASRERTLTELANPDMPY